MIVRLLALRSELGYTDRPDRALPEEPEAVSAAEQRELTAQAARAASERYRVEWERRRIEIVVALDELQTLPFARELAPDLRLLQHQLGKLERRVLAQLAAMP
jgi:hypothetical protein